MSTHEFVFGEVPCLIVVQGTPATATMFVWLSEREIRPIGDRMDPPHPIELVATQSVDALNRTVRYLEKRFGVIKKGPGWLDKHPARSVVGEPLRDERVEVN